MQEGTNNSCKMIVKWDFSGSSLSGKETEARETYKLDTRKLGTGTDETDYLFEVVETKHKVRGDGNALVTRFESSPGKDFELLGWGMDMTGASQ